MSAASRHDFRIRYRDLLMRLGLADDLPLGPSWSGPESAFRSTSALFDHGRIFRDMPSDIKPDRLAHELKHTADPSQPSHVRVRFPRCGSRSEHLRTVIQHAMHGSGMYVTSLTSDAGLILGYDVARVDIDAPFEGQRAQVTEGMACVDGLRRWVLWNAPLLRHWIGR